MRENTHVEVDKFDGLWWIMSEEIRLCHREWPAGVSVFDYEFCWHLH
jgi:hypothetical protein